MDRKVLVCGGNGAGKSTLGRALAAALGCRFLDVEDYYFPSPAPGDYPYRAARKREDFLERLLADLAAPGDLVMASVKGDFGPDPAALFTHAVLVDVPKALRLERVRNRSRARFGPRMAPGGDLYEQEEAFFAMAAGRSSRDVENWLSSVRLPALRVDGTLPPGENTRIILRFLSGMPYGKPGR